MALALGIMRGRSQKPFKPVDVRTVVAGTSEVTEDRVQEIRQPLDSLRKPIPRPSRREAKFTENIHTYPYSALPEVVFLAPKLNPATEEHIRMCFE